MILPNGVVGFVMKFTTSPDGSITDTHLEELDVDMVLAIVLRCFWF